MQTLYDRLISEANLKEAAHKAMRDKRGRHAAAKFWFYPRALGDPAAA